MTALQTDVLGSEPCTNIGSSRVHGRSASAIQLLSWCVLPAESPPLSQKQIKTLNGSRATRIHLFILGHIADQFHERSTTLAGHARWKDVHVLAFTVPCFPL
eukprot:6458162-Amphidinium_carterae.2